MFFFLSQKSENNFLSLCLRRFVVSSPFKCSMWNCCCKTFSITWSRAPTLRYDSFQQTDVGKKNLSYDMMSCMHKTIFFVGIFSIVFERKSLFNCFVVCRSGGFMIVNLSKYLKTYEKLNESELRMIRLWAFMNNYRWSKLISRAGVTKILIYKCIKKSSPQFLLIISVSEPCRVVRFFLPSLRGEAT